MLLTWNIKVRGSAHSLMGIFVIILPRSSRKCKDCTWHRTAKASSTGIHRLQPWYSATALCGAMSSLAVNGSDLHCGVSFHRFPLALSKGSAKWGWCQVRVALIEGCAKWGWCQVRVALIEGGAKWGWCQVRVALIEGGAKWGWCQVRVAIIEGWAKWGWCQVRVAIIEGGTKWGWC
jgi:hypothetical protein